MQFKVNTELVIKNASDQSGVLVFVCFTSAALLFDVRLHSALVKINDSLIVDRPTVESWLVGFSIEDKIKFWDSLISNYVLVESETA